MRISGPSTRPPEAEDVPSAISGATALLGQRPAITGLRSDGRREQGFASLAGWVAKGANLLAVEFDVGPGDRVALAGPPGWPLAAIALSAWWVGAAVVATTGGAAARLHVVHCATTAPPSTADVLWFGDGLDGTCGEDAPAGEQWTEAVTPHGDRPPAPTRDADLVALIDAGGRVTTQRGLLGPLAGDPGGVLGMIRRSEDMMAGAEAPRRLAALALRPMVTGSATVVIDDGDPRREAHAGAERVAGWFD